MVMAALILCNALLGCCPKIATAPLTLTPENAPLAKLKQRIDDLADRLRG
jgi:hypothetical protein